MGQNRIDMTDEERLRADEDNQLNHIITYEDEKRLIAALLDEVKPHEFYANNTAKIFILSAIPRIVRNFLDTLPNPPVEWASGRADALAERYASSASFDFGEDELAQWVYFPVNGTIYDLKIVTGQENKVELLQDAIREQATPRSEILEGATVDLEPIISRADDDLEEIEGLLESLLEMDVIGDTSIELALRLILDRARRARAAYDEWLAEPDPGQGQE